MRSKYLKHNEDTHEKPENIACYFNTFSEILMQIYQGILSCHKEPH